jgi:hypothetical protein
LSVFDAKRIAGSPSERRYGALFDEMLLKTGRSWAAREST